MKFFPLFLIYKCTSGNNENLNQCPEIENELVCFQFENSILDNLPNNLQFHSNTHEFLAFLEYLENNGDSEKNQFFKLFETSDYVSECDLMKNTDKILLEPGTSKNLCSKNRSTIKSQIATGPRKLSCGGKKDFNCQDYTNHPPTKKRRYYFDKKVEDSSMCHNDRSIESSSEEKDSFSPLKTQNKIHPIQIDRSLEFFSKNNSDNSQELLSSTSENITPKIDQINEQYSSKIKENHTENTKHIVILDGNTNVYKESKDDSSLNIHENSEVLYKSQRKAFTMYICELYCDTDKKNHFHDHYDPIMLNEKITKHTSCFHYESVFNHENEYVFKKLIDRLRKLEVKDHEKCIKAAQLFKTELSVYMRYFAELISDYPLKQESIMNLLHRLISRMVCYFSYTIEYNWSVNHFRDNVTRPMSRWLDKCMCYSGNSSNVFNPTFAYKHYKNVSRYYKGE